MRSAHGDERDLDTWNDQFCEEGSPAETVEDRRLQEAMSAKCPTCDGRGWRGYTDGYPCPDCQGVAAAEAYGYQRPRETAP